MAICFINFSLLNAIIEVYFLGILEVEGSEMKFTFGKIDIFQFTLKWYLRNI